MINYAAQKLVITIVTSDPVADHVCLMNAIAVGVRLALGNKDKSAMDAEHLKYLLRLQQELIPDELQLERAYTE